MEKQQQTQVPLEELAMVELQKDIQIANLMKAVKEKNQQIQALSQQLDQMQNKKTD